MNRQKELFDAIIFSFFLISNTTTERPEHSSTRTAMSVNTDPVTGQRVQTMTTSQLQLAKETGELRIACKASRVQMDARQDGLRTGARSVRGSL